MKKLLYFCILLSLFFSTSCVFLNTVSLSNIPKNRSKTVAANSENYVFLGFNFSNDYVDKVSKSLKDQCEGGVISGILTKNETICLLPLCLILKNKITAKGYCQL